MFARTRWMFARTRSTIAVAATLAATVALCAGCQGNAKVYRYIEAVNAERRALEDRVYDLEYELETLDSELENALHENDDLRRQLGGAAPPSRRSSSSSPSAPARREKPIPPGASFDLAPPEVDAGEPDPSVGPAPSRQLSDEPEQRPAPKRSGAEALPAPPATPNEPNKLPAEPDAPASDPAEAAPPEGTSSIGRGPRVLPAAATIATTDREVVRISLEPSKTGGADFDGRPGDDGVSVLVQPKNAAGQVVLDPADISVAVLDPNKAADAARIARWDLRATEVERLAEEPEQNRGYKLHFAWPDRPPATSLLRLYVRYSTADGQHFDTEQEVHLDLSSEARAGRPGWRSGR